jgi:hypothetical protein
MREKEAFAKMHDSSNSLEVPQNEPILREQIDRFEFQLTTIACIGREI